MAISRTAQPLESRHYVDAGGKYAGSVGGLRIVEIETPEPVMVPVLDDAGKPVLDENGAPVVRTEQPAPIVTEHEEWPEAPVGAVEVPAPPASHLESWDGKAWVPPAPDVIAADKLAQARDRIASNPEFSALIDAVAARLGIIGAELRDDVAGRIAGSRSAV
jgi:hypothetical protein